MKKEIILDGAKFRALSGFYNEVERKFTKGLNWKIGRNLNAYNDVLRGGFGVHKYEEPILIRWMSSSRSKKYLGHAQTINYLKDSLKHVHPTAIKAVKKQLERMKTGKGKTLFDMISGITKSHPHIELRFE